MSAPVFKSVFCDPKPQHIGELRLLGAASNVGCNGKGKLCKRQASDMKSSTKSEIDISSLDKKPILCRCQTKAEAKPRSVHCCQKAVNLLKSKSLGLIPKNSSLGGGVKKSPDSEVKFDPIFLFQLSLIGLLCLYLATGWQDETCQRKNQDCWLLRRPNVSLSVHQSNRPTTATITEHAASQKERQRVPWRDQQNRRNHYSPSTSQPREVRKAGSPLRARPSGIFSQIEDSLTWIDATGIVETLIPVMKQLFTNSLH